MNFLGSSFASEFHSNKCSGNGTRALHRNLSSFLGPSIHASINLLFLGVCFQTRSVAPAVAPQSESGHESRHCELSGTTGGPLPVYVIGSGE